MNEYIGHFTESDIWDGNVCLGAHNRGYPVNYFQNIKYLKADDIVIYQKNNNIREYKVNLITKIKDTDWTYLQSTQENKITLITCVEDEDEYRLCIQAVESRNI